MNRFNATPGWACYKGGVGGAISDAISKPVEAISHAVELTFTDPGKLTIGDALNVAFPVGAPISANIIERPETLPVYVGAALGASFALEGSTVLQSMGLKAAAINTPGSTPIAGPLLPPPSNAGFLTGPERIALADAGNKSSVLASLPNSYATTSVSTGEKLATAFSTQGGKIGIGDAIVNGLGSLPSILSTTAPVLLLSQLLGGKPPDGGGSNLSPSFGISIPQGIREAAQNFLPPSFGFGGGPGVGSAAPGEPQQAGMTPLTMFLIFGAGLGVVYYFVKRRK